MLAVSRFEEMGIVDSQPPKHTEPNQEREVAKNQLKTMIAENPKLSLRKAANLVGFSHMTVRTILVDELHLHPYKYQMCHSLKGNDYERRLEFAHWFLALPPRPSISSLSAMNRFLALRKH